MVLEVQVSGEGNSGGRVLIWACAWLTPEARTTAMVMQWARGGRWKGSLGGLVCRDFCFYNEGGPWGVLEQSSQV